jgi:hypothetical protein
MTLRSLALCSLLGLAVSCGGDSDSPLVGEIVRLDDASDEVLENIADTVDREGTTIDGAQAARLTAPADGATVPAATPFTFEWAFPLERPTPRHGETTGTFVWLRLDGDGMDEPLDVVALTSTSFTPTEDQWARLTAVSGQVSARVITTQVDRGVIEMGPFEAPDGQVAFTIAP